MDVLSDVLKAVRLTGAIFFERHLHAPWVGESPPSAAIASMVMPDAQHVISFHAILSGCCWAGLSGSPEFEPALFCGRYRHLSDGRRQCLELGAGHARSS